MSYALSHLGEAEIAASTVAARTPNYAGQALAIMGVAAVPWIPVFAGGYVGDRLGIGKGWGALAGFSISFLVLFSAAKSMGGNIT